MKANWIVEFLQCHDYEYERNIGDNEVWRNNVNLIVIHPNKGVKLLYRISIFNEYYNESTIERDIKDFDQNLGSKIKNTPL